MRILGINLLNYTIPGCFQLMGKPGDYRTSKPDSNPKTPLKNNNKKKKKTIKVIKTDGMVKIYDRPINVSELLLEYPKHLVCNSDSFYIGQKIPSLSNKDKLKLGQNYFLLPKILFQSALSFVTIATFSASSMSIPKAVAATCTPFDIQKTSSGCLKINVSDEFISNLIEENTCRAKSGILCSTDELEKDYKQLVVGSRHCWKPKLQSIKETDKKRKKMKHKLSASFRVLRRKCKRKPKSSKKVVKSEQQHHHVVSLTSCSKPNIKIKKLRIKKS